MKHKYLSSKLKKTRPLRNDRVLSRHVPETRRYHDAALTRMLATYSVLYIKPDRGTAGTGIIRVKRLNRSESLVSFKRGAMKSPNDKIAIEVKKRMRRGDKYIIQQGVQLGTYRRRPYDLRVVLQKPYRRWRLTWMSAKVAPRSDSIVTNVAKGARDAKILDILRGADQPLNVQKVLKILKNVSYGIARKLGARFPFRIVGLDMAIDKKGKVWFLEANTKPNFHGLRKLDPVQYRRYLRAKKQIEANL